MNRQQRDELKRKMSTPRSPGLVLRSESTCPVHSCGHPVAMADVTGSKCGACRAAHRRKAAASKRQKREDKRDDRRLPDGAVYTKSYRAESKEWSGTLTVQVAGQERKFSTTASGSFRLEMKLDAMYRQAMAEAKPSPEKL